MAAGISRFARYFSLFAQYNSTSSCLKLYKPYCKTRVRIATVVTYEVKSERLDEIARSPSGWVPPQSPPPTLPFEIKRSKTNNLPVYIDKKHGGSLVLTIIRNVRGDLNELVQLLKENLGEDVHFQTNEITSQVKIKGYHKEAVVRLLKEHGF